MTDDLRALLLLYRKSKEGAASAVQARTDAEGMLREARQEEARHKSLLESVQPLIHKLPGGSTELVKVDQEIAEAKAHTEGKPGEKAEGKPGEKAEAKAPTSPAATKGKPAEKTEGAVTFRAGT